MFGIYFEIIKRRGVGRSINVIGLIMFYNCEFGL